MSRNQIDDLFAVPVSLRQTDARDAQEAGAVGWALLGIRTGKGQREKDQKDFHIRLRSLMDRKSETVLLCPLPAYTTGEKDAR